MNDANGKTILVTGANGFIGARVVQQLRTQGAHVVPLTRADCDLTQRRAVATLLGRLSFDHVIHLAAFVPRSPRDDRPGTAHAVNVQGTLNVFDAVADRLGGVFCYISTLEVYGQPQSCPITEEHPTNPLTHYGTSKLEAELALRAKAAARGVALTILRPSVVYGPGERIERAIPNIIRNAVAGQPPAIHGEGSDLRDYLYVEDAARGIVQALSAPPGTYNLASGRGVSIRAVAELVLGLTDPQLRPVFGPRQKPKMDIVLSIDKARRAFGFAPQVPLEEGLKKEIEWVRTGVIE